MGEVCAQEETGYACGEKRRALRWWQIVADTQLRATLKDILEYARDQRRREPGRRSGRRYQWGACNNEGMTGYGAEASEMGDAQVSGGPCGGETMRERYAGIDTGKTRLTDDTVWRK